MALRIILLGPPGAGKGTQAKLLAERLGLAHVASGDLFRSHLERGTPLGLQAKRYMEQGLLVPDEVTIQMVLERVRALEEGRGVLLDGFPRTLPQAEALDRALAQQGQQVDAALLLEVPEEEVQRRITGRRTCPRCQAVYHVEHHPPQVPGRCDVCGAELEQRPDDRPEAVQRRLQVYREQTTPLVDYYARQGKLRRVPGTGTVEEVQGRLAAAVRALEARV